jgi:Protein of unknown function (DUF1460)
MISSRRKFLSQTVTGAFGLLSATALGRAFGGKLQAQAESFKGEEIFDRILTKALKNKWETLPIGQTMGHVAMEFRGTPYVGFTLELSKDREICSANLTGLDCVTFFEDTLDFSRMLKKGGRTPEAMLAEIEFTRYRGGVMGDFTSRLHYTTDWLVDNQKKKVVKILAPELPGAVPFAQKVGIMSEHPENYRQLAAHPEFIPKIRKYEKKINSRSLMYIPLDKLKGVESYLQTGDIVGVCESVPGIDIGHTGLVIKDAAAVPHFMDASSMKSNMKVTLETPPISETFNWSRHLTGAMFARPLEPVMEKA